MTTKTVEAPAAPPVDPVAREAPAGAAGAFYVVAVYTPSRVERTVGPGGTVHEFEAMGSMLVAPDVFTDLDEARAAATARAHAGAKYGCVGYVLAPLFSHRGGQK